MTPATRLRSPIFWFGGKGMMISKLLKLIPPHEHYVEPFGGGASLLFAKEPCGGVEVYNDLDEGLTAFFRVLRDPELFARFYHLAAFTPYSRPEYDYCRETWEATEDPADRAYRWFVVARMCFSGDFGAGWSSVVTASIRGRASTASKWQSILAMLPALHERAMMFEIEGVDFRRIIERYNAPGYLLYADPPYVHGTRTTTRYAVEMSDDDHRDLVRMLLDYPAMVMLSSYASELYAPLDEAGWDRTDFHTACHAAGRTRNSKLQGAGAALKHQARVESVWRNPAAMAALTNGSATLWEKGEAR